MSIEKRQRGGQPNNTNALKHGYYASKLPEAVAQELRDHKFTGLEEEKEVIHFFLARVLQLGAESEDLQENLEFLRVVSLAITTLTRIVRTEKYAGFLSHSAVPEEVHQLVVRLSARYDELQRTEAQQDAGERGCAGQDIRSDSFCAEPESFDNEPDVHPLDQIDTPNIRSDSFSPASVGARAVRPPSTTALSSNTAPAYITPPSYFTAPEPQPPADQYDPFCLIEAKKHPPKPQFFQPPTTHDRF